MDNNAEIFRKGLLEYSKRIEQKLIELLDYVAQDIIIFIEGSPDIPVQTGNLRDSTGIGIYQNGILRKYQPLKTATIAQEYEGNQIWGFRELEKAYTYGITLYSKNTWLVLFSAVPYAIEVDSYADYFDDLIVEELKSSILQQITKLR